VDAAQPLAADEALESVDAERDSHRASAHVRSGQRARRRSSLAGCVYRAGDDAEVIAEADCAGPRRPRATLSRVGPVVSTVEWSGSLATQSSGRICVVLQVCLVGVHRAVRREQVKGTRVMSSMLRTELVRAACISLVPRGRAVL
jgi:hypothetical protein